MMVWLSRLGVTGGFERENVVMEEEEVCRTGIMPSGANGCPNGLAAVRVAWELQDHYSLRIVCCL